MNLTSDVAKARNAAKGIRESDEAKMGMKATNRAKTDAVATWKEGAKRVKELKQSGDLPADAVEQEHDRDADKWNPWCNLQDSALPEEVVGPVGRRNEKDLNRLIEDVAGHDVRVDYALRLSVS